MFTDIWYYHDTLQEYLYSKYTQTFTDCAMAYDLCTDDLASAYIYKNMLIQTQEYLFSYIFLFLFYIYIYCLYFKYITLTDMIYAHLKRILSFKITSCGNTFTLKACSYLQVTHWLRSYVEKILKRFSYLIMAGIPLLCKLPHVYRLFIGLRSMYINSSKDNLALILFCLQ